MRTLIAFFITCCSWPAFAQIEMPSKVSLGKPIVARALDQIPSGAKVAYDWQANTPGCTVVPLGEGESAHIWACPGKHMIDLVVAVATADDVDIARHQADLTVGGNPPPGPAEKTLDDLVSAEAATVLAEFHADWSANVAKIKSREVFDTAYQSTRSDLKLTDIDTAYKIIDSRLQALLGVGPGLAAELNRIAFEFGGQPIPPQPDSGARLVLIVHETKDDTTHLTGEFVKLQTGPESKYLKKQGHRAVIYDDDLTDGNNAKANILRQYAMQIKQAGLPAVVIIDRKTEQALHSQRLPKDFTAANLTELIRQHGG